MGHWRCSWCERLEVGIVLLAKTELGPDPQIDDLCPSSKLDPTQNAIMVPALSDVLKHQESNSRGVSRRRGVNLFKIPSDAKCHHCFSAERDSQASGVEFEKSFLIERGEGEGDSCAKGGVFPMNDIDFSRPARATFVQ